MVYGRYNELVFMGIIMVYTPTYNWGGPAAHHVSFLQIGCVVETGTTKSRGFSLGFLYNVMPPKRYVCWFINPMNTIVI